MWLLTWNEPVAQPRMDRRGRVIPLMQEYVACQRRMGNWLQVQSKTKAPIGARQSAVKAHRHCLHVCREMPLEFWASAPYMKTHNLVGPFSGCRFYNVNSINPTLSSGSHLLLSLSQSHGPFPRVRMQVKGKGPACLILCGKIARPTK